MEVKRNLSLSTPVFNQFLQAGLAESVLAEQGTRSFVERSFAVHRETYLARQFIVATTVLHLQLAIQLSAYCGTHTHCVAVYCSLHYLFYTNIVFHIL